jgi:hypothetical protein
MNQNQAQMMIYENLMKKNAATLAAAAAAAGYNQHPTYN